MDLAGRRSPISDGSYVDATALATIKTAYASGVRYFDTAPFYGYGLGKHRIGHVLRNRPRAVYVLSTKVGCLLTPRDDVPGPDDAFPGALPFDCVWDYSHDAVMRSFEDSLQRLSANRVDMLLIQGRGPITHGADHARIYRTAMDGAYRAIARLKDEGAIAAIGLGVEEWEVCLEAMRDGDFDCILMAGRYTLLEQDTLATFLSECARRGVSVIVGGPFNSGILAKGAVEGATYEYATPPSEVGDKVRRIAVVCARHGIDMAAAALQLPLAHPAVASVIPGAVSPQEQTANTLLIEEPIPRRLLVRTKERGASAPECPDAWQRSP